MSKLIADQPGIEKIINDVFPKAMIERVENFDDVYGGWFIAPQIGTVLKVALNLSDPWTLTIDRYSYNVNLADSRIVEITVFAGKIPLTANNEEPDLYFVEQLLRNYSKIGG